MSFLEKAKILLFDCWVANKDRMLSENGGNPNLILSSENDKLWVIDHNLAFLNDVRGSFSKNHMFAEYAKDWTFDFKKEMTEKMHSIIEKVDEFWQSMPNEWKTENTSELNLEQIKNILAIVDFDDYLVEKK